MVESKVDLRVSFDIGGVLSKHPDVFRPLVAALQRGGAEVYVLTDMSDHAKATAFVRDNGYDVPPGNIVCCDYSAHGEVCKLRVIESLGIALHVDDFAGYSAAAARKCVSLFVWPDPDAPYFHDDFKTDGSEGAFGRKTPAQRRNGS